RRAAVPHPLAVGALRLRPWSHGPGISLAANLAPHARGRQRDDAAIERLFPGHHCARDCAHRRTQLLRSLPLNHPDGRYLLRSCFRHDRSLAAAHVPPVSRDHIYNARSCSHYLLICTSAGTSSLEYAQSGFLGRSSTAFPTFRDAVPSACTVLR